MNSYCTDDIIFALATPWAKGAIAVIRVSGQGCLAEFQPCFSSNLDVKTNTAVYGFIRDGEEDIDEVLITVFREGHGYTGQESFEINCHGGLETVKQILSLLQRTGFRSALGGEFTLRAFINGRMDLTRSEAVNELINASSNRARAMALSRLEGSLEKRIKEVRAFLLEIMGKIEVQLDYAEDEVDENLDLPVEEIAQKTAWLEKLSQTYRTGKLYSEGAKIVLCGAVNAGKSSLFNLFLKEDRSIVSPIEGTTRDFIESSCNLDGIPVRLFDTAGLRHSSDLIEAEGIKRTQALLQSADILLYLVDATEDTELDEDIVKDSRCIKVLNKSDLISRELEGFVKISAKTGEGFANLCSLITKKLTSNLELGDEQEVVIESLRQKVLLDSAVEWLEKVIQDILEGLVLDITAADLNNALDSLGQLVGEVTSEEILDNIFSRFCVGK